MILSKTSPGAAFEFGRQTFFQRRNIYTDSLSFIIPQLIDGRKKLPNWICQKMTVLRELRMVDSEKRVNVFVGCINLFSHCIKNFCITECHASPDLNRLFFIATMFGIFNMSRHKVSIFSDVCKFSQLNALI